METPCNCIPDEEQLLEDALDLLSHHEFDTRFNHTQKPGFAELEEFYEHWELLQQLYTAVDQTEAGRHESLHRTAQRLRRAEFHIYEAFEAALSPRVESYKAELRQCKAQLKRLQRLEPGECVIDVVLLRDRVIQCNRQFAAWFPPCLQPPVDTFPREAEPLCSESEEAKRWFCISRLLVYLPKPALVSFKRQYMTLHDLGVQVAYEVHAQLIQLPSARFSRVLPATPSASEVSVSELPVCLICGGASKLVVNSASAAGHELCGAKHPVCYECFRAHAWSQQHNGKQECGGMAPVPCPFCRHEFSFTRGQHDKDYSLCDITVQRAKRRALDSDTKTSSAKRTKTHSV